MSDEFYKEIPPMTKSDAVMFNASEGLNKVASLGPSHIPEKLAHMIKEIERQPEKGMVYFYDRALGAGEIYGANNNGDYFARNELIEHHGTFEKYAHPFKHHQNKDPRNAIGKVMGAAYNYPMDTVDLIFSSPIEKVASEVAAYNNNEQIQTSMGAKVPCDECSICGKRSKTRMEYCEHLRFQMLKVLGDGRQVYAKNPSPKFVDISIVVIPADPASAVLRKIASMKVGEIKKNDIGTFQSSEIRPTIHPRVLETVSNAFSPEVAIATLHKSYGILRPDEFQAVLRKDASLIRRDIIPFVGFEKTAAQFDGKPHYLLADRIKDVSGLPIEEMAKKAHADFLTKEEKIMYLGYRNCTNSINRMFIR